MNTVIQNIKNEINKAETELITMATECINNGNTNGSYYNCVVTNIAALSQMGGMLKTEKKTGKRTEKPTKNTSKEERIKTSLTIDGKPVECVQNKDIIMNVCKYVTRHNFKQLNAIEDKLISEVTGKNFACTTEQDGFTPISSGKKTFYFDTKKMMSNNFMLLKKMIRLLDIPETAIQIA